MFRVTFTANGSVDNFAAPDLSNFTIVAGPAQSSSSQVNIANGKVTQNVQYSYTYTLQADKEGKFTIGVAKVKSDGKEAQTQPFTIECVKGEAQPQQKKQQQPAAGAATGGDNSLYIGVTLSKKEVYRGEHIVAKTKLYVRNTSISNVANFKVSPYTGFWTQDIEAAKQLAFVRENVNGAVYDVGMLYSQLLFPQQSGELTIAPSEIDVVVQVRARARDVFEDFFGGGYQNINKHLQSKPLKVKVKDLPSGAPASFAGAVGNFKVDASVTKNKLTANDATTLTIRVSGSGNLKLINAPKVELPIDFEVYDTKTTDAIKNSDAGSNGYRLFEIPLIPRSAGDFIVPPIEFSFFNPVTEQYTTLRTKDLHILVEKDTKVQQGYTSSDVRKEGIKSLGHDIRFIKVDESLDQQDELFFGSALFFAVYAALLLAFVLIATWLKKHKKDIQNVVLVRNKKANKVAKKRLQNSAQLLKMGNAQGFYNDLLRAMWGYLSDKLSIPAAELSRESAQVAFAERNIEVPYIETFLSVIDECEFARYAPSSGRKEMEQLYREASGVISKLEQRIR
jgi:hypothetical protein